MLIDLTDWRVWACVEAALLVLLIVSAPTTLHRDFAALMNFKRVRDSVGVSMWVRALAAYLFARGMLYDVLVNMVHLSILMWEWPREWTVTERVGRLQVEGTPRQRVIAMWFCQRHGLQLNDLDPSGCHCRH